MGLKVKRKVIWAASIGPPDARVLVNVPTGFRFIRFRFDGFVRLRSSPTGLESSAMATVPATGALVLVTAKQPVWREASAAIPRTHMLRPPAVRARVTMTAPLLKKVVEEDNNANNPFGTTMAMAPGFDENVAVIEDLLASPPSAGTQEGDVNGRG